MALSAQFGIDWQDVVPDSGSTLLADLRTAIQDPIFTDDTPDLDELRLAIDHAPVLVQSFLKLYQSHRTAIDNIMRLGNETMPADMVALSSETTIHDFFRSNGNHFDSLERAAEQLAAEQPCAADEMYMMLKARLRDRHGITVAMLPIEEMKESLRIYDAEAQSLKLSDALDMQNRTFQMAHVLCLWNFPTFWNRSPKAAISAQSEALIDAMSSWPTILPRPC